MILLESEGLLALAVFGLWIYCVLDVIATDEALMRSLPKPLWLMIVIFVPTVGSIAWLLLGRPERAGWRPGDTTRRRPLSTRFVTRGPEDDPNFSPWPPRTAAEPRVEDARPDAKQEELRQREQALKDEELRLWEADLARREDELRRRAGSSDDTPSAAADAPPTRPTTDPEGFEGHRW